MQTRTHSIWSRNTDHLVFGKPASVLSAQPIRPDPHKGGSGVIQGDDTIARPLIS